LFRGPRFGKLDAMLERNPCVYIMTNGFNDALYTGLASNLLARVIQHRDGTFDGFTKRHNIKRLVWYETTDTMDSAIAAEKRIKKWRRDWKKNAIERDNPHWDGLAVALGFPPLR